MSFGIYVEGTRVQISIFGFLSHVLPCSSSCLCDMTGRNNLPDSSPCPKLSSKISPEISFNYYANAGNVR